MEYFNRNILKSIITVILIIIVISIITSYKLMYEQPKKIETIELTCSLNNQDYIIIVNSNKHFKCSNCSKKMKHELKTKYIEFKDMKKTYNNIEYYFINKKGGCE